MVSDLVDLRIDLIDEQRDITQLEPSEISDLEYIANQSDGWAGTMAKNILRYFYGYTYESYAILPEDYPGGGPLYSKNDNKNMSKEQDRALIKFEVNPNPASVYVAFTYELPVIEGPTTIIISDIVGKVMQKFNITSTQGQLIWDTREVPNGIYYYYLKSNGKSMKDGKIIVNK